MKGQVDADVADETCRQAWGARELLLRWGFAAEQVQICTGYPMGEEYAHRPLEQRPMQAFVQLCDERLAGDGKFRIACGPLGVRKQEWGARMLTHLNAIAAGVYDEALLHKQYQHTNAWIGRDDIAAALRAKGIELVKTPVV